MEFKDIFKKSETLLDEHFYSFEYFDFIITRILYEESHLQAASIFEKIKIINPLIAEEIFYKRFNSFLEQNYLLLPKQRFILHDSQIGMYEKANSDLNKIIEKLNYNKTELYIKAVESYNNSDYNELCILSILILGKKIEEHSGILDNEEIKFFVMYHQFLKNEMGYIKLLGESIDDINPNYDLFLLSDLILDRTIVDYLFIFDIILIKDLKNTDINLLVYLLNNKANYCLQIFKNLKDDLKKYLSSEVDIIFSKLSTNELDVLDKRNGWNSDKLLTLDEIGQQYFVTRERIRQIEKSGHSKAIIDSINLKTSFICLFRLLSEGEAFISKEKLFDYFNDDIISHKIICLLKDNINCHIKYFEQYQFIYDAIVTTPDEVVNNILAKFGNIIAKKEIEDELLLRIIKDYYHEITGKFKRKGLPFSAFILDIIDNNFPNGYRISSAADYEKFCREYENKFEESFGKNKSRVVICALNNNNYRLIDRGTYLNPIFCPSLAEELLQRIMMYIESHDQIVYYNSIYATFEKELLEIGINNMFFLKGTLDFYLKGYSTKRDYIILSKDNATGNSAIVQSIKSFEGQFNIEQLKEIFPGVNEYVFTSVFYKEKSIISLSNKNYIYFDKLDYSSKTINALYEFLKENMDASKIEWVSSQKLFERLSQTRRDLLTELKLVDNHFALYSLIKVLFEDQYYWRRPIISNMPIEINSLEELIINYARSLEEFNKKTIDDFSTKKNIQIIFDYTKFMETLSDEYVRVNIDTMVKKSKLMLTDELLMKIEGALDLIFSKYKEIDTRTFHGYYLLPSCKIKWNKYSLKGIVSSYLSDKYLVEVTDKCYHITDFIIFKIDRLENAAVQVKLW